MFIEFHSKPKVVSFPDPKPTLVQIASYCKGYMFWMKSGEKTMSRVATLKFPFFLKTRRVCVYQV